MNFIERTNKKTGLKEVIAVVQATIQAIETTSRTNSNDKPFGFMSLTNDNGDILTGMAYDKTAKAYPTSPIIGDTVTIEALASDIADGINKNWQLALPTASDVSDTVRAQAKKALGL